MFIIATTNANLLVALVISNITFVLILIAKEQKTFVIFTMVMLHADVKGKTLVEVA